MGSQRSIAEIGELVREHRFLVAGVALGVLFVALLATFFVPHEYASETTVRVLDNAALQSAYGRDSVEREMVGRFRQDLTSREAVLEALEATGLSSRFEGLSPAEKAAEREEVVAAVQEGTEVDELAGEAGELLYRVTLRGEDPVSTLRLLTQLVTGYQRRRFAERDPDTSDAFAVARDSRQKADAALEAAGRELDEFLAANEQHHFGEETDTAGRLSRAKAELEKVGQELAAHTTRLRDERSQLAEETEWRELDEGEEGEEARAKNEVWEDLKNSERALVAEIAVKKRIRKTHAGRVDELSELVRSFPELEQKWKQLVQAKSDLGAKRDELVAAETSAREAWQARAARGALVFDVVAAPGQPGGPEGSQRLVLSLVGLVLGLCGGVGSVLVMGITDKSYHRSDEVAAAFDVPVLGAIARIETPVEREESRRRMRRATYAVGALALLVGVTILAQLVFDGPISAFFRSVFSV